MDYLQSLSVQMTGDPWVVPVIAAAIMTAALLRLAAEAPTLARVINDKWGDGSRD